MDIRRSQNKVEYVLLMKMRTKSCAWKIYHPHLKVEECRRYVEVRSEGTTFEREKKKKKKRAVVEEERFCECYCLRILA